MKATKGRILCAALLGGAFAASPALAITAGDVMDKMEPKERHGFIGGAVDMASHLYAVQGKSKKADCAVQWFFYTEDSLREIHKTFDSHKSADAVGLLARLIDRHCPN